MDDKNKEGQGPKKINIELGENEAQGIYSNLAIISHSQAEFVIDFTRLLPGVPKAKVHSRIIMTPQHAKMLLRALNENVHRYETQNGEIKTDNNNQGPFGGFVGGDPKIN
ncbi:MAG: DUF3467 domain-containing protein [Candidatus Kapaibacterium sp.]